MCWGGGEGGGGGGESGHGVDVGRKWEQLLLYVTHCINPIYIALNFQQDIL